MRPSWFGKDGTLKKNVLRRYAKPITKLHAKRMKLHLTATEKLVGDRLKLLGIRIRKQAIILGWIVDFYHPQSKTVFEIDGGYHQTQEQKSKDRYRDSVMMRRGLRIVRFENHHVETDLPGVINQILKAISSQQKTADLEACGRRGGSREVIPPTTRRKPEIV